MFTVCRMTDYFSTVVQHTVLMEFGSDFCAQILEAEGHCDGQ